MPNLEQVPYIEKNLIDLDDPVESEETTTDHDDILSRLESLEEGLLKKRQNTSV